MSVARLSLAATSRPTRLERLELLRYGKFTDLSLDFPVRGLDFHLVLGANEAGKSTVRAAIPDLLFGFGARTPYAFAHHYDALRLGGVIAREERREHFQRLKRAKNTLRDADDQPLREDLLTPYLGEMDRVSFERMFCLDHGRLVQGGDEILTSQDDLAHLLFQASSGITGFRPLREALEKEAREIWAPRRSGERAFYRALDELQQAEKAIRETTVRARDWVAIEKRVQASREALSAARRSSDELETRRARLERIRRVAPELQKLRDATAARLPLAAAARLPHNARAELERAEKEIAAAAVLLAQAQRTCSEAQERLGGIVIDRPCLEHAAEIRALTDERARTEPFARDIETRSAELRLKSVEASRIAAELGWEGEEAALAGMIPSQAVRATIARLLQEYGGLVEAATSAERTLAERRQELATLELELRALAPPAIPAALRAALAGAQALGQHTRRVVEVRARVELERGRCERLWQQLRPWQGSEEELRALVVPPEAEAREQQTREQELIARVQAQRNHLAGAARELAAGEARAEHLARTQRLITRAALEEVRGERDALWQRIRARSLALDEGGEPLAHAIARADRLADQRYAGASDVARLEQLAETLVTQRRELGAQEHAAAALESRLAALREGWQARMRALGLEDLGFAPFLEWSRLRAQWLQQSEQLATQEAELSRLLAAGRSSADALRGALASYGEALAGGEQDIETLAEHAADIMRRAEARTTRHATTVAQRQSAVTAVAAFERRAAEAHVQLGLWETQWREQIAAARLSPDTGRSAASLALEHFAALATLLREIRELREQRIDAMRSELDAFARRARQLAAVAAPELAAELPQHIARSLAARLDAAERNVQRLDAARTALERAEADIERAREQRERAEASLGPLMERAAAAELGALRAAVERSERLAELDSAVEAARSRCLEAGDPLALEALEAEVDAEDLATLNVRLAQLDAERNGTVETRESLAQAVTADETELRRFGGQADAALAEARRQEALASMSDAVERFIKVFVAARLLGWCIDRYREEKQGPLLQRASEIFSILTRGSFARLAVDFDGKSPQLEGCRADGRRVGVAGMSDGTRDQLYLALRLAALELQLEHGRALPFVADDLFINFDDERSAAGFQALAELARQTQVIFLTHHEHLVPIVERAIGPSLNVVRLV